jgi:glyoxylase-like metal-dependent hydrolase (beta-lactamase superfamily II)
MTVGDPTPVPGSSDLRFVDTGMYGTPNYGGVYVYGGESPLLVESGTGADREAVFGALDALDCIPEALLLTHVHLDHAGGAGFFAERFPEMAVYVHESGARHLASPDRLVEGTKRAVGDMWEFYADPKPIPEDRIETVADGDVVSVGGRTFDVRSVPGHAPHQVAFRDEAGPVFAGDAAGLWVPAYSEVVPTTPPPQFDLDTALADLETLRALDPDPLCYTHCGPGPADADAALDAYDGALRSWVARVRLASARADDPGEAFADEYERRFADVWGARKAREEAKLNLRGAEAYLAGE